MGNPNKQASNKSSRRAFDQSTDAATDMTLDEGELVSIATLKQMLDVQQSMIKTLFNSFISTVNARVDKLETQSRLSKQALSSHKRMSKICRP